jgi:hypothetical protein
MSKSAEQKREVIGVRLDVLNPGFEKDNTKPKWLTPEFSFRHKGEARAYREKHYPNAKVYRIYNVRMQSDYGIPREYYINSMLSEKEKGKVNVGTHR